MNQFISCTTEKYGGRRDYGMALKERYDLILMDLSLPTMDGVEVVKNLRGREKHSSDYANAKSEK